MLARLATLSFVVSACSLSGLSDGSAGGQGGLGAGGSSSSGTGGIAPGPGAGGGGAEGGDGGTGGIPPSYDLSWAKGFGNPGADLGTNGTNDISVVRLAGVGARVAFAASTRAAVDFGEGLDPAWEEEGLTAALIDDRGAMVASWALGGDSRKELGGIVGVATHLALGLSFRGGTVDAPLGASLDNTNGYRRDGAVLVVDTMSGAVQQALHLRGSDASTHQYVRAIASTGDGDLLVGGAFGKVLETYHPDLGAQPACDLTGDPGDSDDAFVMRLGSDLTCEWAVAFGSDGGSSRHDSVRALVEAPGGEVVLGGSFRDEMLLAGNTLTAEGSDDAFVASFSAVGSPLWSTSFGRGGNDRVLALAVLANGDVVAGGRVRNGSVVIPGCPEIVADDDDGFVARLDATDGACEWAMNVGKAGDDATTSLVVIGDRIYASGYAGQAIVIQGEVELPTNAQDAYVLALDADNGSVLDSWVGQSVGQDSVEALVAREEGLLLAGAYAAPFDGLPSVVLAEDLFAGFWPTR